MKNNPIAILGIVAVVAVVLLGGLYFLGAGNTSGTNPLAKDGRLDGFAQCLTDAGVKFYGAFWCPHCQNQKRLFGDSASKLPYIECSTPDGRGQLPACNDAGIQGYPTWIFADGERVAREMTLEELAEKTSCELPTA